MLAYPQFDKPFVVKSKLPDFFSYVNPLVAMATISQKKLLQEMPWQRSAVAEIYRKLYNFMSFTASIIYRCMNILFNTDQ